jgi:hypothetical protein
MTGFAKSLSAADVITDHAPVRRLSCLEAMRERRGDIACFTPALLVTHGKMPHDPVQEFVARFNVTADHLPFCVDLPPTHTPFFRGLGSSVVDNVLVDWDRRIYAIPVAPANLCFDFLGGIGVHGQNFYASAVTYELNIPDPTALIVESGATIPLHIFGVLIHDQITYLAPNGYSQPVVTTVPAAMHLPGFRINPVTELDLKRLTGEP